jgi:hypothetical protein
VRCDEVDTNGEILVAAAHGVAGFAMFFAEQVGR